MVPGGNIILRLDALFVFLEIICGVTLVAFYPPGFMNRRCLPVAAAGFAVPLDRTSTLAMARQRGPRR